MQNTSAVEMNVFENNNIFHICMYMVLVVTKQKQDI